MNLNKKIGIFSFVTALIFLCFLLLGGLYKFYQSTHYIETYFNESVKGLSVGQSVRYRGVQIGYITHIDFLTNIYLQSDIIKAFINHPYVYVRMKVNMPSFDMDSKRNFDSIISELVKNGMRVSITPEGITGGASLELDFDHDNNDDINNIKINWIPQYPYIPSSTSTLSQLTEIFKSFHDMIKKMDLESISNKLSISLNKFTELNNEMNEFIVDLKANPSQLIFKSKPERIL